MGIVLIIRGRKSEKTENVYGVSGRKVEGFAMYFYVVTMTELV